MLIAASKAPDTPRFIANYRSRCDLVEAVCVFELVSTAAPLHLDKFASALFGYDEHSA